MKTPLSPLELSGIPFARIPVQCYGSRGTPYTRWTPVGMPQLGQYKWILDLVFFLYKSEKDANSGKESGGTGFWVSVPSKRWPNDIHFTHGVTNWHVACQGCSVIRVNRQNGAPEVLALHPEDWIFRPNFHDIAVTPPIPLQREVHKAQSIHIDVLLKDKDEQENDINAAEDVFMVGRFVDYHGSETNAPAFRFGNISILNANIRQPNGYFGRSIVLDMHSRSGFSGSPVFVYRNAGSGFPPPQTFYVGGHLLKLLGIHWGQFPEKWNLREGGMVAPEIAAQEANRDADQKYIEGLSGMTCACPASAIFEIIMNTPSLQEFREREELRIEKEQGGSLPSALAERATESEPSTTADNPRHKEDFNSLVGAAARKKPQADQT